MVHINRAWSICEEKVQPMSTNTISTIVTPTVSLPFLLLVFLWRIAHKSRFVRSPVVPIYLKGLFQVSEVTCAQRLLCFIAQSPERFFPQHIFFCRGVRILLKLF